MPPRDATEAVEPRDCGWPPTGGVVPCCSEAAEEAAALEEQRVEVDAVEVEAVSAERCCAARAALGSRMRTWLLPSRASRADADALE